MKSPKLLKKLTPGEVLKIKLLRAEGWTKEQLMDRFGVSLTTINWHIGSVLPPRRIIGEYSVED